LRITGFYYRLEGDVVQLGIERGVRSLLGEWEEDCEATLDPLDPHRGKGELALDAIEKRLYGVVIITPIPEASRVGRLVASALVSAPNRHSLPGEMLNKNLVHEFYLLMNFVLGVLVLRYGAGRTTHLLRTWKQEEVEKKEKTPNQCKSMEGGPSYLYLTQMWASSAQVADFSPK
jgi:hypothetical protein